MTTSVSKTVRVSGQALSAGEALAESLDLSLPEACARLIELGQMALESTPAGRERLQIELDLVHAQRRAVEARKNHAAGKPPRPRPGRPPAGEGLKLQSLHQGARVMLPANPAKGGGK